MAHAKKSPHIQYALVRLLRGTDLNIVQRLIILLDWIEIFFC